jgi:hypothetical protein
MTLRELKKNIHSPYINISIKINKDKEIVFLKEKEKIEDLRVIALLLQYLFLLKKTMIAIESWNFQEFHYQNKIVETEGLDPHCPSQSEKILLNNMLLLLENKNFITTLSQENKNYFVQTLIFLKHNKKNAAISHQAPKKAISFEEGGAFSYRQLSSMISMCFNYHYPCSFFLQLYRQYPLKKMKKLLRESESKYGFFLSGQNGALLLALIKQESSFDQNLESYTGARGLMQMTAIALQDLLFSQCSVLIDQRHQSKIHLMFKKNAQAYQWIKGGGKHRDNKNNIDDKKILTYAPSNVWSGFLYLRHLLFLLTKKNDLSDLCQPHLGIVFALHAYHVGIKTVLPYGKYLAKINAKSDQMSESQKLFYLFSQIEIFPQDSDRFYVENIMRDQKIFSLCEQ